jgi:RluA family pseudouridine synthase
VAKHEEQDPGASLRRFLGRGVREIFRDDVLWVLDKPPGVLSHPNPPAKSSPSALLAGEYDFDRECYRLRDEDGKLRRVWLVHRLDRDTSGVILCALTAEAGKTLKDALTRRDVKKEYLALVLGIPRETSGEWRNHLERSRREGRVEVAVTRGGHANATTAYETLRRFAPAGLSLLALAPREGRTHQLRVQCARHGHPIAGDDRYGDFAANRELAKVAGLGRMYLVAHRLSFKHPASGKQLTFASGTRPELEAVAAKLESLRKPIAQRKRSRSA